MRWRALAACLAVAGLAAGCGASAAPAPEPPASETPAPAPAPARSEPFALVPDAAGDEVAVAARAGARRDVALRLANGADRPRTFALAADRGWIAVPASVTVPARQSLPVAATVTVPGGAVRGDAGRVTARPAERSGGRLAVDYTASVTVRLRVAP